MFDDIIPDGGSLLSTVTSLLDGLNWLGSCCVDFRCVTA